MSNEKKHGFTIIEVVLVLAIASLIFVMVFIAVPNLRRTERDTHRRNDMSRFMAAMVEYRSHNKNNIPFRDAEGGDFSDEKFVPSYLDHDCVKDANLDAATTGASNGGFSYKDCKDGFRDPDGTTYMIAHLDSVEDATTELSKKMKKHTFYVAPKSKCINTGDEVTLERFGTNMDYSVYVLLEGGSPLCMDSTMSSENTRAAHL